MNDWENIERHLEPVDNTDDCPIGMTVSDWQKQKARRRELWNNMRSEVSRCRTSFKSPSFLCCAECLEATPNNVIRCSTCLKELCPSCDQRIHGLSDRTFHQRVFYVKDTLFSSILQPMNYIDSSLFTMKFRSKLYN